MGGTSSSQSSQSQQSQVTPYQPAQAGLNGLLSALGPSIGNINGTPQTQQAFDQLFANAGQPNPFTAPATNAALTQLGGASNAGTANGILTGAYGQTQGALSPYLSGNALDPSSNPALAQELSTVGQQVQDTINPVFSAAGRLGSPANAKAIATGITQGATPLLQNAASNQLNAAGLLNNAASGTAGGLLGSDVANSGILGAGINNVGTAYNTQNLGPQNLLTAAMMQQGLPVQLASSLAGILGPIAGEFGQTNSTGTSSGTQTMSGAQQFGTIAGGLANISKFLFG